MLRASCAEYPDARKQQPLCNCCYYNKELHSCQGESKIFTCLSQKMGSRVKIFVFLVIPGKIYYNIG